MRLQNPMKKEIIVLTLFLFIMTGCGGNGKSGNDGNTFVTVDVTKNYPKKELILQDLMDVEYIALETNEEFITQGWILATGKDIILVRNDIDDGNIYLFDRTGKGLRKFNRMGQGPEEYNKNRNNFGVVLDEDNNEIFINDLSKNRILVYDLFGTFKRSFRHQEGFEFVYIYNFDRESLICQDDSCYYDEETTDKLPFVIISKQDGSVIKDISIFCQPKIPPTKGIIRNGAIVGSIFLFNNPFTSVIPYRDSWIFTVYSADTIFRYFPDHSMIPFIVRTPSIQSDNSETFLHPITLTERYYILQTNKLERPEMQGIPPNVSLSIPETYLAYDRQEKTLYEYTVYNDDYSNKTTVKMLQRTGNGNAFWQRIEAHELVEAYGKGLLKGKLKDIAAKLDMEDNSVIMLVKYKE